jgi:hypothetical protein
VTSQDPDGRLVHGLTTAIADATLTIWARRADKTWRVLLTATSEAAATLEIGDREGTRGIRTTLR